jgi:N6-L-threonylcarbamoyladenine synthase
MLTLGIETSCDETSASIVEDGFKIRSNIVSTSLFRHKPYGGVVPEIASRHSLEQIDTVFSEALKHADVQKKDLDLVAVTSGPGLIGSLLVGVSFAKALSFRLNIPLVAVNHLEAHLSACFMVPESEGQRVTEFVGLLVSGGHTMITHHKRKKVEVLGETVDDAVGEAYDKVAKLLGLGFPGGPIMDRLAKEGNPDAIVFTKPKQKNRFDFSYSGIKTAVLYHVQKQRAKAGWTEKDEQILRRDVAASFQKHAVLWLVDKTMDAVEHTQVKHIAVGGGVSANSHLRARMTEEAQANGIKLWLSPLALSGDNAAMIACRGWQLFKFGHRARLNLAADPNLKIQG